MFYFASPRKTRALVREGKRVVDVSSRASPPYCFLSPFYPHGNIPVPGMKRKEADSVEGVWQGLKVISGRINPNFFHGSGRKRRGGAVEGHQYGARLLDYRQARHLIYVPLYRHMVFHAPLAREEALKLLQEGLEREVWVHDVEENGDIENLAKPLAHAAVLVDILNENLAVFERYVRDERFRAEFEADAKSVGTPRFPLAEELIHNRRKQD